MSGKDLLENIKKLREMTGVGFKDCKTALDETGGNIEKSVKESENQISVIEINSETDFVAKNLDFINFCKELSEINFSTRGNLENLNNSKMKNGIIVKDNLVNLIAKIGEKITIRRTKFFDDENGKNFFYVHSALEKNIGKIVSIVKIDGVSESKNYDLGTKIAMHIAASNPLAIDKNGIDKKIIDKELEIIQAEITNSGKPKEMAEKIAKGKLSKFLNDNSLLSQIWILDPKKKVEDVLKENSSNKQIKIVDFVKFKVGEGV